MALYKELVTAGGVPLNYHRVVTLTIMTNNQNVVEVGSYPSAEKRQEEKDMLDALRNGDNNASCDVFIDTTFFNFDYDPGMTIENAYEALKELEIFAESDDVREDLDIEEGGSED